ncbi:hypothetical protein P154DRAFT_559293 [Amniculicola lignicola CBS 123094]|uniref:F-box domain-containing protein n=1 Tax=Amniculicola lignicola CBS 123094 TaxID=1392246 RepID=A0A6A5WWF3_9PLEO|nr:hypothetical protein P154DRAFT_559293 [Amniculicola lignicola CBS 123094]
MDLLADELLDLIVFQLAESRDDIRIADVNSLVSLCLVSRRHYRIAKPHLYQSFVLKGTGNAPMLLLRTLNENPDLAVRVHTVEVVSMDDFTSRQDCLFTDNANMHILADLFGKFGNISTFSCSHSWGTKFLSAYHRLPNPQAWFWDRLQVLRLTTSTISFDETYCISRCKKLERVIFDPVGLYADLNNVPWPMNMPKNSSIKNLTLRPTAFTSWPQVQTLVLLANQLPNLESLRIELANVHHEPCICVIAMMEIFKKQLAADLRKLEITHNGDCEVEICEVRHHWSPATTQLIIGEPELREHLRKSQLTHLSIDIDSIINRPPCLLDPWVIQNIELPQTLRQLDLRYADPSEWHSNTPTIPDLDHLVEEIRRRFTVLEYINLELCTQSNHDALLDPLKTEFARAGITFQVTKKCSLPVRCWERPLGGDEKIRFSIFTGHGPEYDPNPTI